jgi:primosomal protein N' (replication factor Y)
VYRYSVIVDLSANALDRGFDYVSETPFEVGTRVSVPFGKMTVEGFIIKDKSSEPLSEKDKTINFKSITAALDPYPVILPEFLEIAEFLRTQNVRLIDSLRLFIPSKLRGGKVKALNRNYIELAIAYDEAVKLVKSTAKAQLDIIERLKDGGEYESILTKEFSQSGINTLCNKGILTKSEKELRRTPKAMNIERKDVVFTAEQANAIEVITKGGGGTYLLHGVTGSGKTEVYMRLIDDALASGKTAIMLVPEIYLTPQMLGVFRSRFGESVSVLHSGLSDGERYDEWARLIKGEAQIALGARSALFAPLTNLGVIIIDEEHDGSYISESNPRYFTIECAELRQKESNARLVLGSATPSVDTYLKAKKGEYTLIEMNRRANNKTLPRLETVDMRLEMRDGNLGLFSKPLLTAIDAALEANEQVMVFLNRRGYTSKVQCRKCGYVAVCTDCDVSLTYHKSEGALKCHYCGNKFFMLKTCPKCGASDFKDGKTGTEKVVTELQRVFPNAKIARMDNDSVTKKDAYLNILQAFANHESDILVGTQMLAKGHDFKSVTLVGILDADQALYFPDYRSYERTFQLITQVAGRAGREEKAGRVIMQTLNPDHFVFRFAEKYDYHGFYEKEINSREVTKFPPFSRIYRILVTSEEQESAVIAARGIYTVLRDYKTENPSAFLSLAAAQSEISRIENKYRYQIIIVAPVPAAPEVAEFIYSSAKTDRKGVFVSTDINPQQLY